MGDGKVWEEEWEWSGPMPRRGSDITSGPRRLDHPFLESMSSEHDERVRLASAAPDLVRALLACEAKMADSGADVVHCPLCGTSQCYDGPGKHEPGCPWDAALRKAGIR